MIIHQNTGIYEVLEVSSSDHQSMFDQGGFLEQVESLCFQLFMTLNQSFGFSGFQVFWVSAYSKDISRCITISVKQPFVFRNGFDYNVQEHLEMIFSQVVMSTMGLHEYEIADPATTYNDGISFRIEMLDIGIGHYRLEYKLQSYNEYLRSKSWYEKRNEALKLSGLKCVMCGAKHPLHVHHLNYEKIGFEDQADLVVLCGDCHRKQHGVRYFINPHAFPNSI